MSRHEQACRYGSLNPKGISPASRNTGVQGSPSPPQAAPNQASSVASRQTNKRAKPRGEPLTWTGRQAGTMPYLRRD
ncbi:hypothetical protein NDU88_005165 [Pleurodeles waltl]|uniref:Uncharacterized protein n=1 Tax=Pleurodeles waltl TaxID=8319 RepID=A0AAV7NPI1_PLEWA|nr:hypothetical protein NDU88_005165 [Pleurodeles waltl]